MHQEGRKIFVFDSPGNYRIRVIGCLDERWSEILLGMTSDFMKFHTRE